MTAATSLQTTTSAVTVIVAVLGPNLLGLLAVALPRLLERFWAWSPSTRLEVLALLFLAVFVPAIVLYSYLTRDKGDPAAGKGRPAAPARHSRFLPPLEIALLQIGNATFLTFAIILAVMLLGFLAGALQTVITYPSLVAQSFTLSLFAAAAVMALSSRPGVFATLSWRRLSILWARRARLAALAIAGFAVVGVWQKLGFLKIDVSGGQLQAGALVALYTASVACLLLVHLLIWAGTRKGADPDSVRPLACFMPAVGLAWVTNLLLGAIYVNAALLTLHAHVAGT